MSTFKDTIRQEINDVFLDPGEFAHEILFDGVPVWAVIDDSAQAFDTGGRGSFEDPAGLGLLEGVRALYVKDGDLPYRVQPEQQVTLAEIDNCGQPFGPEHWQILDVQYEDGVVVMKMTRVYA